MTLLLLIGLKGALVLLLGTFAARGLRRAPASARHGIWAATFAALLLVPALDALGPDWAVSVLPAQMDRDSAVSLAARLSEAPSAVTAVAGSAVVPDDPWARLAAALCGAWALGGVLVASVWLRAFALARRLVRDAAPVADSAWTDLAARVRTRTGLSTRVRLLRSDALRVPIAWGYGRPAVVLPPSADGWDEARREAVLLHEMAHLRRRDAWTQAVAQAALALHWPNPFAWLAYRHFMDAREQACDDAVLRVGATATDYAAHLVAVARELSPSRLMLAAVSPMTGRGELEIRVRAVLDDERRRTPLGRLSLGATLALTVAVGGPLAAFQPVPAAAVRVEDGEGSLWIARQTAAEETRQQSAHQRDRDGRLENQEVQLDTGLVQRNDTTTASNDATTAWNDATTARNDATIVRHDAATVRNNAATAFNDAMIARNDAMTARNDATRARKALDSLPAASSLRQPLGSASHE